MALETELSVDTGRLPQLIANTEEDKPSPTVDRGTGTGEACMDPSVAAQLGMYI
jgi:hypothetical protein